MSDGRRHAVLVLSGGQDSATCGIWLRRHDDVIHTISFDYGQRHHKELDAAVRVASLLGAKSYTRRTLNLFSEALSSLTDGSVPPDRVGAPRGNLPNTFLPGRNLLFLTAAAIHAAGIRETYQLDYTPVVVTGVCQTDYSGYPDCRADTIKALEEALRLGMDCDIRLVTPLMGLTKAETVRLSMTDPDWRAIIGATWTCYLGEETPCGACPACLLRIKGFQEAGVDDPAVSASRSP